MKVNLQYLLDNGIIDISNIQSTIEMKKRKEYLNNHPYQIWEGKDGKWHVYLPDDRGRRIHRKRNTKEEIEDIVVEYQKMIESNPTVENVFRAWNKEQLDKGFIKTNTACRNDAFFKRHFQEFGLKRIKTTTPDMWVYFLEEQIPKYHLTAKSFSGVKGITKGILKKAKREGYISFNYKEVFDELMISKNCFHRNRKYDWEEVYTIDETASIMDYCKKNPDVWSNCIMLIFITGLRVGEAVALKQSDIDPQNYCIHVQRTESRTKDEHGMVRTIVIESTKTDAGDRIVFFPKQFQKFIASLWWNSASQEFVFENNGKRVHSNAVRKKLNRICSKINVPYKPPHKIRKTFCSILLDNDIDKTFITSQMGHTDISTSEIFYHKNRNSNKIKVDLLSNIVEFAQ